MASRQVARPNSFIFTLFGDYVGIHNRLWVGSLIRLMAQFGLSEQAVRQAVSRMSRQGWLQAERSGNRSYYSLTEHGGERVRQISPRIYEPIVEWDGRWRMLVFRPPVTRRARGDRLRKDLAVLGFAPLTGTIWLSPADAIDAASETAHAHDLLDRIDQFTAQYDGPLSDRRLLERCWDLPAIAKSYDEFIAHYRPRLREERERGTLSSEGAFVERLWLVHDFRRFAYLDPGLPSTLLPAHWPGTIASALFREYYAAIAKKAQRFFASQLEPR
ncbi:MAG: phenylacetic acid degradation operon negative regulatory protein PaaX [Candidatus Eremiobacteraeota bacterium]|nr:phenylacetic acid degradation operon negative regulatory protein PaaX [Candidatus Eremiobacteraeota bacterium]